MPDQKVSKRNAKKPTKRSETAFTASVQADNGYNSKVEKDSGTVTRFAYLSSRILVGDGCCTLYSLPLVLLATGDDFFSEIAECGIKSSSVASAELIISVEREIFCRGLMAKLG